MKNVTALVFLSDGQQVPIETHFIGPEEYGNFFRKLVFCHEDAPLITHGFLRLIMEGDRYFEKHPLATLGSLYERCDLSREESCVHWVTVKSSRSNQSYLAGILEWVPVSSQEVLIQRLYVLKGWRRRGIGTQLLSEAVKQITLQGYSFLVSGADLEPESGRKFLLKSNFCRLARGIYKRNLRGSNDIFFQVDLEEPNPIIFIND